MKLEQKVALCTVNKIGHPLPAFACQTSGFHFRLFISSLCALPRTNLLDFQLKPPRGIRSSCQIADEFEDDLTDDRVRKLRCPVASTQDNDDLAKTLRAV
jgi:hypothetical protein